MSSVPIVVRHAGLDDLDGLVGLRMENGRVHAALEPGVYRVPDASAVRAAFLALLRNPSEDSTVVLLATIDAQVVGMAELVPSPPPPPDQILVPVPSAQIHIVVAQDRRGAGVGARLRTAVERLARDQGIRQLVAPIHAANARALDFYAGADYGERGR